MAVRQEIEKRRRKRRKIFGEGKYMVCKGKEKRKRKRRKILGQGRRRRLQKEKEENISEREKLLDRWKNR